MRALRHLSIRTKQMVIIMLTSAAAVLLACAGFVAYDVLSVREEMVEKVTVLADVVGNNCAVAIDFSDPASAQDTLRALQAEPAIVAACVYGRDGHVFASYSRTNTAAVEPPPVAEPGHAFAHGLLGLSQPITWKGERIGTVFLASDLTELKDRLRRYPTVVGTMLVISLFVALVLSSRLQRVVSDPILRLAHVARSVAVDRDYSVRAAKSSNDELGELFDGFNEMLGQIQERDTALRAARDNLEQRVAERTRELANSLSLLNATLEASADGILAVDLDRKVVCYNSRFLAMWGIPPGLANGTDHKVLLNHALAQLKSPEQFLDRVAALRARPDNEAFDVLELKDGRTFERLIRPQYLGEQCVGSVLHFRDITERKLAEEKLETTHRELVQASRQAGMAEVATSVLHNVGNVLNSLNISASLVADHLKTSKTGNVARVAALLREHGADLGEYLTRDPRGMRVPAYLSELAEHLAEDQAFLLKEMDLLRKHLEHVKDIVAMQQSYAKVAGVTEPIRITDLVEDALRMNASALVRHDIQLVREFETNLPQLTIEKHKVLQILVNLIKNAQLACDESGRSDKRLTVRVSNGSERIRIAVDDNGVGIPAENLAKVFNHGFTTRKGGHGFGLHSGALAAREMGGALIAYSDGPGRGAIFTLELPLQPPG